MDRLPEQIERCLKDRSLCLVLEDELERCWPSEKIEPAEQEKQIQTFAELLVERLHSQYGLWSYEGNIPELVKGPLAH